MQVVMVNVSKNTKYKMTMLYHQDHADNIVIEYKDDHGCYLAVEIVSNILKKAQGQI